MKLEIAGSGRLISLKPTPLGSGGEADVWETVEEPSLVAKIYRVTPGEETVAKLQYMLDHAPNKTHDANGHCFLAWPKHLLRDVARPSRPVVGFLMLKAVGMDQLNVAFEPRLRKQLRPNFGFRALVIAATNLAHAVEQLHKAKYVIGDINDKNVLIDSEARVTIIDVDSFQVYDERRKVLYRSRTFRPEYRAPELQETDPNTHALGDAQDLFGLGILIHQLLFCGSNPFSGAWKGSDDPPEWPESICKNYFIHKAASLYQPVPGWPTLSIVPPDVRALMHRCFVDGHVDPVKRPQAGEWCRELKKLLRPGSGGIKECDDYPDLHQFDFTLDKCPWCTFLPQRDFFGVRGKPKKRHRQIPLQAATKPGKRRTPWILKLDVGLFVAGTIATLVLCILLWNADPTNLAFVRMTTNKGDIVLELNRDIAIAEDFLKIVRNGAYDHTIFHNVDSSVIQGGTFTMLKTQKPTNDFTLKESKDSLSNRRGTIAMTRKTDDPSRISHAFYINVRENVNFDGPRSGLVFGRVVHGMKTVDAISALKTSKQRVPQLVPSVNGPYELPKVPVETVEIIKASEIPASAALAETSH